MSTDCTTTNVRLQGPGGRELVGSFDGGAISSDGGATLLSEVERRTGIIAQLADCFTDHRKPEQVEHTVEQLLAQRIFGLALGYEDLNDHDTLRCDPLLAALIGHDDPTGEGRRREADRGKAGAGKSTLNRLELSPPGAGSDSRYKKIVAHLDQIEQLMVTLFVQAHEKPPKQIVLDVDSTDDPLHGDQLGKRFHGYYDCHCYLPLYVTCGEFVLAAKLRPSNIDDSRGVVAQLDRLVRQIRQTWPDVQIIVRGDGGFCRDSLMKWCEHYGIGYVLGLAKNPRLKRMIAKAMHKAKRSHERSGKAARRFVELRYRTLDSWSCERRVVAKAEYLSKGENPRFIVTNLSRSKWRTRPLYETLYCARGDMENRIKEQQLDLFADRTSAATMRANQIRLYLSTFAYTLMAALRRLGLADTELARAQCSTIRTKLLKIGTHVRVTTRKVWLAMSSAFPLQQLFIEIHRRLVATPVTATARSP